MIVIILLLFDWINSSRRVILWSIKIIRHRLPIRFGLLRLRINISFFSISLVIRYWLVDQVTAVLLYLRHLLVEDMRICSLVIKNGDWLMGMELMSAVMGFGERRRRYGLIIVIKIWKWKEGKVSLKLEIFYLLSQ